MKKTLLILWHIAATVALVRLWSHFPAAVPPPPASFVRWTLDMYGAQNGEDLFIVETYYMLTVSFIVVAAGTFLANFLWQHRHKPR